MSPTLKETAGVEDLDHGVPLHFAGPGAVVGSQAAPEDPALAQALDEDALPVGAQQHAALQVLEELPRHLPLPLVLDLLDGREAHVLEAVGHAAAVDEAAGRGDAAALGVGGHYAAHGGARVVEGDEHLGEGCGREREAEGRTERSVFPPLPRRQCVPMSP